MLFADGFDEALIGVGMNATGENRICYDYEKCVEILMRDDEMTREDAMEYLSYNTLGAYVGPYTPIFIELMTTRDEINDYFEGLGEDALKEMMEEK